MREGRFVLYGWNMRIGTMDHRSSASCTCSSKMDLSLCRMRSAYGSERRWMVISSDFKIACTICHETLGDICCYRKANISGLCLLVVALPITASRVCQYLPSPRQASFSSTSFSFRAICMHERTFLTVSIIISSALSLLYCKVLLSSSDQLIHDG